MLKHILLSTILLVSISTLEMKQFGSSDFSSTIQENQNVIVMFYSPNCPHCKSFEPEFDQLPELLKDMNVVVGKMNCIENDAVCEEQDVQGYPTTYFFNSGSKITYEGQRKADSIVQWINKFQSASVQQVTQAQIQTLSPPYVLAKGTCQKKPKMLKTLSFMMNEIKFYHLNEGEDSLTYVNKKNEQKIYEGQCSVEKIKQWLTKLPSIVVLTDMKNFEYVVMDESIPTLLIGVAGEENKLPVHDVLEEFCDEQRQRIRCGEVTKENPQFYQGVHQFLRQENDKKTAFGVIKQKMKAGFIYPEPYEELTKQKLSKFVEEALAESIKPTFDDRPPTSIKFEKVQLLTNDNFEEFIQNNEHVFINFYDPSDEASLIFSVTYQTLALQLQKQEDLNDIKIVAVDCKATDKLCEEKLVSTYPTLRLYANGYSIDFKYEDKPEIPAITSFLNQRKKAEVKDIENEDDLKRPSIIFYGPQKNDVVIVFPKLKPNLQAYYMKAQNHHIKLLTAHSTVQYEGNLALREIQAWASYELTPLLFDLLIQQPDEKLIEAVRNKELVLFFLDVDKDLREQYRKNLGDLCKKLKVTGGYAEAEHPGYAPLIQWIGVTSEQVKETKLLCVDLGADKKYMYSGNVKELNEENLLKFMEDIKENKIQQIKKVEPEVNQQKPEEQPQEQQAKPEQTQQQPEVSEQL